MTQTKSPSDFMAEAAETVEELAQALERLDVTQTEDSDPELLNLIFRKAHSLKGLSSLGGQEKLVQTAHILEDALDALRMGKVALDDALYDALVDSVEVMSELLGATARNEESGFAFERAARWADRVGTLLASSALRAKRADSIDASGLDPAIRGVLSEYEEHRLRENLTLGVPLRMVHAKLGLDAFDSGWNDLMSHLRESGEVLATLPSVEGSDEAHVAFNILWASRQNADRLAEQFKSLSLSVTSLVSKAAEPEPVKAPKQARSGASTVPQAATLRIDLAKLDSLMTAVGDLILTRTNLKRATDATRAGQTLQAQTVDRLARETRALERKLDELQRGLLEARMVPLRHVFERLIRMVPRLLKEADKEIDFEIAGGDVQLDKVIADELLEPLVHLLRNAIDHGIESASVRKKRGKSEEGLIRLSAINQGNHVVIDISDDGGGMDESKIRSEAVSRGLTSAAKAKTLRQKDLFNLVFLPGFSTRKGAATEWSGRGVGLDIVKTNLQKLSGVINIDSEKGKGTRFELTLPVTLSIVRALVIRVSEEVFAIPVNAVLEIVSVRSSELVTVDRRQMLKVRGQTVPMVRLAQLFQLPHREVDRHLVVLLGLAQHRLALAVDALIGQQDVVTKPLSPRLSSIPGFAATADLGDHRAVLVLDVPQLVNEVLHA